MVVIRQRDEAQTIPIKGNSDLERVPIPCTNSSSAPVHMPCSIKVRIIRVTTEAYQSGQVFHDATLMNPHIDDWLARDWLTQKGFAESIKLRCILRHEPQKQRNSAIQM